MRGFVALTALVLVFVPVPPTDARQAMNGCPCSPGGTMVNPWLSSTEPSSRRPGAGSGAVMYEAWATPEAVTSLAGVPGDVRTPDLNGDGRPDLVALLFGADMLSVRLNLGGGTFGPAQRYPAGQKPSIQETGDFNGDGKVDIAVTNTGSKTMSVFFGNGDGTLQPARTLSITDPQQGPVGGAGAFGLVVGDFNHDHNDDIATVTTGPDRLTVLLGAGDGNFGPVRSYPSPSPLSLFPFALASGDFNHDHNADLVSGGVGSVTTYQGSPDGSFMPTHTYDLPGVVVAWIDVADVNHDGHDDVVLSGTGTHNLRVLLGNGDGSFRQGENLFSEGIGPQGFDTGDLNGDGIADIAVANTTTPAAQGNLAIFLGTGHGHFRKNGSYPAGFSPFTVSINDLDGDHIPDIASAVGVPSSVSIFIGRGDGSFRPRVTYPM